LVHHYVAVAVPEVDLLHGDRVVTPHQRSEALVAANQSVQCSNNK